MDTKEVVKKYYEIREKQPTLTMTEVCKRVTEFDARRSFSTVKQIISKHIKILKNESEYIPSGIYARNTSKIEESKLETANKSEINKIARNKLKVGSKVKLIDGVALKKGYIYSKNRDFVTIEIHALGGKYRTAVSIFNLHLISEVI